MEGDNIVHDSGLSKIDNQKEISHSITVNSWIEWLKRNGREEEEKIFYAVYKMIKQGSSTLSGALELIMTEMLPPLAKKRTQSGDARESITQIKQTYDRVKEGYLQYLKDEYPSRQVAREQEQKKAKATEKVKEYIKSKEMDIKTVFSMINHTVYQKKSCPEKKILPEESQEVLKKIQKTIAPEDPDFPKELFEAIIYSQDKKVIHEYKKFMNELNHDIEKECESAMRSGLPEEILPEHKGRMRDKDEE